MEHNLVSYRSNLLLSPLYTASPGFLPSLGWHSEKTGHALVIKKTGENAVASVVGRVQERRLDCGPIGNFQKGRYGGLQTAKFHLLLGKPTGTPFADDFEKALTTFNKIQTDIASTQNRVNFLVVDGHDKHLRFTRNVFDKREDDVNGQCAFLRRAPSLSFCETDNVSDSGIDSETENWPVPSDLRADLDDIKKTYRAVPLPVFAKDMFIEITDVNDTVKGVLVEVHFEFHHYCIKSKNQDSFNATIQQIIVLQPGAPRPTTAYKCKNVRDGPVRLMPAPVPVGVDQTAKISEHASSSSLIQPPGETPSVEGQSDDVNGNRTVPSSSTSPCGSIENRTNDQDGIHAAEATQSSQSTKG